MKIRSCNALEGNELSLFRLAREGISEEETSEMRPDR